MKLGLKCSKDLEVTHNVWLSDNGHGAINIICGSFYLATLTEDGIVRIGGIPKSLGIALDDQKRVKDIQ